MSADPSRSAGTLSTYDVIGTRVGAVTMDTLVMRARNWLGDGKPHYVCFADVNALIQGRDNPQMRAALDGADVVSPDGKPLAVVGQVLRGAAVRKTSGPDFLEVFCARTAGMGVRHFLLGGMGGVAQTLASELTARYPGLDVVGTYSPPRYPFSTPQNDDILRAIQAARPDVVWVGLGAPRQEIWMQQNAHLLPGVTLFGVGAAFDFSAGLVQRAPLWMQKAGLEWAFRVSQEPGRLFRRYATNVPRFLGLLMLDALRARLPGA